MSRCKLRTPLPIHFNLRTDIGIDSLTVCILFGEISIFHSRVIGLYSSNCRRFFICHAVNWEPLRQFTSNFVLLLELIVYWFLKKCVVLLCLNDFFLTLWINMEILVDWRREDELVQVNHFCISAFTCICFYYVCDDGTIQIICIDIP